MTIEILLLALGSAVRPSSFVALYALVRQRSPLRLLIAFVLAGLVFTVALGALIVWVFSGIEIGAGTDHTKGIAEIAAGVLVLFLGAAALSERIPLAKLANEPGSDGRFGRLRQHRITTRTAALAGPATHIPGLLYLIALDLIVSQEPGVAGGIVEIGIYNVIWFAIPILALVVCIANPGAARTGVERLQQWAGLHARTLLLTISFGLGIYLIVRGITLL